MKQKIHCAFLLSAIFLGSAIPGLALSNIEATSKTGTGLLFENTQASSTFTFRLENAQKVKIEITQAGQVVGSLNAEVQANTDYLVKESLTVDSKQQLHFQVDLTMGKTLLGKAAVTVPMKARQRAYFLGANFSLFEILPKQPVSLSEVFFFIQPETKEWGVEVSTDKEGKSYLTINHKIKPKTTDQDIAVTLVAE